MRGPQTIYRGGFAHGLKAKIGNVSRETGEQRGERENDDDDARTKS